MAKKEVNIQRYASAGNMHIEAIINKLFRFESEKQAIEKIESLEETFTISKNQEKDPPKPCVILWVKDFEITPKEKKQGFMGNYGFVTFEKTDDGFFTLSITKIDTELKFHPRRKRIKQQCPNWGHPILRNIKKGRVYETIEQVNAEFQQLHLEYPNTTVPGQNKLYLMIFGRSDDSKNPIQKYVLEIKNVQGGGFTIEYEKNTYEPDPTKKKSPTEEADKSEEGQGHFASMVALKRNKKKT